MVKNGKNHYIIIAIMFFEMRREKTKKEIETSRTFGICHHKIKVVKYK